MVLTRLDTEVVEKGVEDALESLELTAEIVEPILRRLTARQREQAPKPPLRFDDAARAMVDAKLEPIVRPFDEVFSRSRGESGGSAA